jgi:hypothetical protein
MCIYILSKQTSRIRKDKDRHYNLFVFVQTGRFGSLFTSE